MSQHRHLTFLELILRATLGWLTVTSLLAPPLPSVAVCAVGAGQRVRSSATTWTRLQNDGQARESLKRVSKAAARFVEAGDIPGLSIAVINDFKIEWARGFGVLEAGASRPIESTTLFQHRGSGDGSSPPERTFRGLNPRLPIRGAGSRSWTEAYEDVFPVQLCRGG